MLKNITLKFGRAEGLPVESISGMPITVFFGPNNSGKSKILVEKFVIFCVLVGVSYASVADTCTGTNTITNITNTSPSGDYEYVEFTINNPNPMYDVTSVSPPFVTISEERIKVRGKKFKQIVFQNVEWMCSIKTALSLPKKQVKDLKFTDQSEGVVVMVVGYQDGKNYVTTKQQTEGAVTKVIMKFKK